MAFMMNNVKNMEILAAFFNIRTPAAAWRQSATQKTSALPLQGLTSPSRNNADNVIDFASRKLREGINAAPITSLNFSARLSINATLTEMPAPGDEAVQRAVDSLGGGDRLDPWLVDGRTKLDVDGRRIVVDVDKNASSGESDPRDRAVKALARFGMEAGALDGDFGELRSALREKAAALSAGDPSLASAIEYAAEEAHASLYVLENADAPDMNAEWREQREKNAKQSGSIAKQTGLAANRMWGVESLGEDLAVFGLDFSALSMGKQDFAAEVDKRAAEMRTDLSWRYAGTETEYRLWTARVDGSLSRLRTAAGQIGSAGEMLEAGVDMSVTHVSVGTSMVSVSRVVGMGNVIADPLVLDLAGDGIDLGAAEDGVDFDMNGDGQKTRMGFIQGDDALLFLDEDGDGVASSGRELFGDSGGHANGFEKLRIHDDNGDGVIDGNDAVYGRLRLWTEKRGDGVCDADEATTLAEAGVKSISLGYANARMDDGKGNLIGQTGSFTRNDGTAGMTADVWLREIRGVSPSESEVDF